MPGRWLGNTRLQREAPNSVGAQVERLVPAVGCDYCGARPDERCRTKSGAIDPLYHHERWLTANHWHGKGHRIEWE